MDFDYDVRVPGGRGSYGGLADAQLRSAIRFAEAHLGSIQDDHESLCRLYRYEIATMRAQLMERLVRRIITRAKPLSDQQRCELVRRFERHAMPRAKVVSLVRSASRGRTVHLEALSEIEAMAILLYLGAQL